MSRIDHARLAAYDVLRAVREDDAYANLVLPQLLRERRIEGRDAAFATELVGGTLRGQGTYDAIVDHLAGRRPDPAVRDALRLGAHQVLAMRVPDHAAVASTVELVRAARRPQAGRLHQRGDAPDRRARPRRRGWTSSTPPSAVRFSHPAWVVEELGPGARPARRARRAARRRQRAPAGDPGGATRVCRPSRSWPRRSPAPRLAARRGPRVRRPRCDPGRARGTRRGAGRGFPAGRPGPGPGRRRGPRRALARPVRRTRRQGGPARGARHPAGAGCWPTSASRTGPCWSPRRCGPRRGDVVAGDGTRPPGRTARSTGCWSTRRAPGSVPCGAARRAGGGGSPRTSRTSCRCSARCWTVRVDSVRPGGVVRLRDLLARGRRDGRRGRGRAGRPGRRTPRGRGAARARGRRRGSRPSSRVPCSCGRTGTAPTRCSWRCCAARWLEGAGPGPRTPGPRSSS